MRQVCCRVALILCMATVAGAEPVFVRFTTAPPDATVRSVVTTVGNLQSGTLTPQALVTLGNATVPVEIPASLLVADSFELVFSAPGYEDERKNFRKFDFQPGQNTWPRDGKPLRLRPATGATAVREFVFRYPWFIVPVGVLLLGLGLYVARSAYRNRRSHSVMMRIRQLGGDPEDKRIGPYVPLALLGRGGYGTVVKAVRQEELFSKAPQPVALKTMLDIDLDEQVPQAAAEETRHAKETRRQRFAREARVLERLQHDHIVRLVDYSLDGTTPYLAMEYVDGQTFKQLIQQNPQGLPPQQALKLFLPVCEAMLYAHTQADPVIHRDIKPENLMVAKDGTVKVMDLGLAHILGDSRLTRTEEWTGTAQYAPPEYFQGVVTPALDQFSLGAVLFELLTGKPANPQERPELAIHAALLDQIARLAKQRPDLGAFAATVDRMTASDYANRFPSLREAVDALKSTCPR